SRAHGWLSCECCGAIYSGGLIAPCGQAVRTRSDASGPAMLSCGRHIYGNNCRGLVLISKFPDHTAGHTVTWVPTSTTRPVGIWKKSVASLAILVSPMNRRSCQRGMPEWAAGRSERRDRKNDVDMMS